MDTQIQLSKILFLDIETVPEYENFDELSDTMKELYAKKTEFQRKDDYSVADYYSERAGVLSEFSKIVCISAGYIFTDSSGHLSFKVKSFFSHEEKEILLEFKELLDARYSSYDSYLCAHNGKEFDYPFIARRMIINGISLPVSLDIAGKKPWEVRHLDTMELWKFGDYKHYTSIKLLTEVLNIPSPKDDIDGSEVASVYYIEKDLQRIATYCEKDTFTVAQIFLRLKGMEIISQDKMIIA
ncbi:MAG: 3'-5' exonuclease [Flavobacteriales bacterium]|nr:3'-5' exonuclease [Flavobacteriales bacterium]